MTKKYNSPMLQIVSIKNCDIVTASGDPALSNTNYNGQTILAPDRWDRFDYE